MSIAIGRGLLGALLACLTIVIGWQPAQAQTIVVDPSDVAVESFIGFGVEWDSTSYARHAVTDQDYQLIEKRLAWMGTPIVRKMMLTRWALVADGVFDFESREMRELYRQLDICKRLGITVFVTDWGVERSWVAAPGIQDTADPKYANAIGTYLDYLVNRKGYTNIKYFGLVNEPNYEVGNFERWTAGVRNVQAELASRRLDRAITIAGPGHSNDEIWLLRSVNELAHVLGAYDVHKYADSVTVRSGDLERYFAFQWDYANGKNPNLPRQPFIVGEAGISDDASARGSKYIDDYVYGVWIADYAVQAARAGSHAILAWMLDDNSHKDFNWGLWKSRQSGMALRPWFYVWSLLTRYMPAGSIVFRPPQPSRDIRVLASRSPFGEWTFCVVNRGDHEARVVLKAPWPRPRVFRVYSYSRASSAKDADGFPFPSAIVKAAPNPGLDVVVPAEAVVIATSTGP